MTRLPLVVDIPIEVFGLKSNFGNLLYAPALFCSALVAHRFGRTIARTGFMAIFSCILVSIAMFRVIDVLLVADSPALHYFRALLPGAGRWTNIESKEPHGVICRPAKYSDVDESLVEWKHLPGFNKANANKVFNWAMSRIGEPYDFRGVFSFITHSKTVDHDKSWFCSEFVHAGLMSVGIALQHVQSALISPGELMVSAKLQCCLAPKVSVAS